MPRGRRERATQSGRTCGKDEAHEKDDEQEALRRTSNAARTKVTRRTKRTRQVPDGNEQDDRRPGPSPNTPASGRPPRSCHTWRKPSRSPSRMGSGAAGLRRPYAWCGGTTARCPRRDKQPHKIKHEPDYTASMGAVKTENATHPTGLPRQAMRRSCGAARHSSSAQSAERRNESSSSMRRRTRRIPENIYNSRGKASQLRPT